MILCDWGGRPHLEANEGFRRLTGCPVELAVGGAPRSWAWVPAPRTAGASWPRWAPRGGWRVIWWPSGGRGGRPPGPGLGPGPDPGGGRRVLAVIRDVTALQAEQTRNRQLAEELQQAHRWRRWEPGQRGAHDFNNLLQVIGGFAQLVLEDPALAPDHRHCVGQIGLAVKRAERLVRHLLTFGRKIESHRKPLDLGGVVRHTAELLQHTLPKMIRIELGLAEDLPKALADPVQVEQIILNLAGNARDAMPGGGRSAWPRPSAEGGQAWLRLRVQERGGHRPRGARAQSSSPSSPPSRRGRRDRPGAFHGLRHREKPRRRSELPEFPRPGQHLHGAPASGRAPAGCGGGGGAAGGHPGAGRAPALVDDEPSLRELGRACWARRAIGCAPPRAARRPWPSVPARGSGFALVILDLGMPGMGGVCCLRELLAREASRRVLVITGYAVRRVELAGPGGSCRSRRRRRGTPGRGAAGAGWRVRGPAGAGRTALAARGSVEVSLPWQLSEVQTGGRPGDEGLPGVAFPPKGGQLAGLPGRYLAGQAGGLVQ